MHNFYEPNPTAKLYRNQDEVNPAHTELDFTLICDLGHVVLEIGSEEALVWQMLQQKKFVPEIVAELSLRSGSFKQAKVEKLLQHWEELGIVKPPISTWKHARRSIWSRLVWSEIGVKWLSQLPKYIFDGGAKWLFTPLGGSILLGIVLLGVLLATDAYLNSRVILARNLGIGHMGLLFGLTMGSLSLHELGHALAMVWAKAEISRIGIGVYLGVPVLFVDTSPVWSKAKPKRMVTAAAGMMVNALIGAIAVIATLAAGQLELQAILWELAFINLIQIGFSLIPFVKMDGYYILIDLLGLPNLNSVALEEVNQVVHHPRKYHFDRHHSLMLAYGSVSLLASILIALYSLNYWINLIRLNF